MIEMMTFKEILVFLLFICAACITICQINRQKIYWWVSIFWLIMMAKQAVDFAEMMVTN